MENNATFSQETAPVSSFMTRASNVFMSPGELYAEVASAPVQNTSWLIPLILSVVIGILMTVAIFSNQTLQDQIMRPQQQEMQKQIDEGKMTQEQADQAAAFMTPTMFMVFGALFVVFYTSAAIFCIPLVLLLVTKLALKHPGSYKKFLETYGLATLIGLLGGVVTLLLMYSMDSLYAQPSGAMLIKDTFDQKNFSHNLLASFNIFTIWQVAVVGIGISKLTGKSTGTGMAITFALWAVWVLIASALGWGAH